MTASRIIREIHNFDNRHKSFGTDRNCRNGHGITPSVRRPTYQTMFGSIEICKLFPGVGLPKEGVQHCEVSETNRLCGGLVWF
jgi:hypothetical protein